MALVTGLLKNQRKQPEIKRGGYPGQILNPICDYRYIEGRNLARSAGQVSQITFAAPGTLAPNARVTIRITELNCAEKVIELHHCETTAQPLQQLLLNYLNGVSTVGNLAVASGMLHGYTGVADGTTAVDITGPAGMTFTIAYGYEWGRTIDTVVHPALPTTTLQTSANCSGRIPFGRAVVRNALLHKASIPRNTPGGVLEPAYQEIFTLPTGAAVEEFVGIVKYKGLDPFMAGMPMAGCCDDQKSCDPAGVDCGDCMDVFGPCCCVDLQMAVLIEPFATGAVLPSDLENLPLYYRKAANGARTELGTLLVNPLPADTTVTKAANNSVEFIVVDAIDIATGLVVIQPRAIKA